MLYSPRLSPFENEELKQVAAEDSASRDGTHELPRFLPVLKARKPQQQRLRLLGLQR